MPTITGPLLAHLPAAPTPELHVLLAGRLSGHVTSDTWLPEGLAAELDKLRDRHLVLRTRVVREIEQLRALNAWYRAEDRAHAEALREAHRTGTTATDARTSDADRENALGVAVESLWPGIEVLAEFVAETIDAIRENETAWLGVLRMKLHQVEQQEAAARALVDESLSDMWRLHRTGQWILSTSDDGPLGRQPAPQACEPPTMFSRELLATSLERPWHQPLPKTAMQSAAA